MRILSSSWTFFFKLFFPALWITGFGGATVLIWLSPADDPEGAPALGYAAVWAVGSACLLWLTRNLKEVGLDGEWLWVSSFLGWVPIALRDVEAVEELPRLNIHPIILYLDRKTPFGGRIVFMPRGPCLPFRSHPLVGELRRLVEEARRPRPGT